MLGNMKFISRVEHGYHTCSLYLLTREISWSTLENKFHISAHPCIVLSIISISILTINDKLFLRLFIVLLGSRCTKHLNWRRITLQNFWFRTLSGSRHSGIFTGRILYYCKYSIVRGSNQWLVGNAYTIIPAKYIYI